MIASRLVRIFHKGSRTYFYSSLFFSGAVKRDVFALYAFVRTADDFVDEVPQDAAGFEDFVARYRAALAGRLSGDAVIDGFVELAARKRFWLVEHFGRSYGAWLLEAAHGRDERPVVTVQRARVGEPRDHVRARP